MLSSFRLFRHFTTTTTTTTKTYKIYFSFFDIHFGCVTRAAAVNGNVNNKRKKECVLGCLEGVHGKSLGNEMAPKCHF
jgi:hypothetical protein